MTGEVPRSELSGEQLRAAYDAELGGQEVPAPPKRSLVGLLLDNKVKSALVALALAVAAYFGLGG